MSTFTEGASVVLSTNNAKGKIIKLMKSSAKVEFEDESIKIIPLALLEEGTAAPVSRKCAAPVAPAAKAAAPIKKEKPKSYVAPQEDLFDAESGTGEASAAKEAKPRVPKNDKVSKFLNEFTDAKKMYNAVKGHPAAAKLNQVAMKNLKDQLGTLSLGLVKMRLGNMLRSATK